MEIFLSGKKGSGKTTVANYLVKKHEFCLLGFKDALVKTCSDLFNIPQNWFSELEYKEKAIEKYQLSPREIMQRFGTDVCREICEDFWIDKFIDKYEEMIAHPLTWWSDGKVKLVCDDLRFPNELQCAMGMGGRLLRVRLLGKDDNPTRLKHLTTLNGVEYYGQDELNEHESETALDDYQDWHTILSAKKGDIQSLYKQVDELMEGGE